MPAQRHVLLLIETSKVYGRGLLDGIGRYATAHGPWSLSVEERGLYEAPSSWLRSWRGDGVIFRSTDAAMVRAVRRLGVPAVDTNSSVVGHGFPLVYADEDRIAQLAVAHFLERRFQHLAFCSVETQRWVAWRREAFLREVARLGLTAHVFETSAPSDVRWQRQQQRLATWVAALPKPVGILAANDVCGMRLIGACRNAGLRVPEEVAVLGVDNDEVLCRLTSPPLSSIDPDSPTIGYRAAALLDALMQGAPPPADPIWVPAHGVVARQSTATTAIADQDLVRALSFIRERACTGIDVADVVQHVGVSRATLERKFDAMLGTTPRQAIMHVQMERVKLLLAETSWPLERIAAATGYKTQSHLSVVFKRVAGLTPGAYRQATCCGACPTGGQAGANEPLGKRCARRLG